MSASGLSEKLRTNPLSNREDARRLLRDLFAPLTSCFSPGGALVKIGEDAAHFNRKAQWFEGFARPLWGLAPLHAGGGTFEAWDLFRRGIASGTDPQHPEYWDTVGNRDQRSVEMAALGFGLALAPEPLWTPLDAGARERLMAWLGRIQAVEMADNNWHFFPVMAALGLKRIGAPIDEASLERHLARIDSFYRVDGWYGDGERGFIDHYNGFALHFYGLIYAKHADTSQSQRAQVFRDRARQFAQSFRYWFGADGAALPMGRSLTYRFAMAAFWGALAYANVEALPWGQIRGLWARHIRWWMRQPILDAAGRLTVGYRWPNLLMSEEYNSPGSPYWAFKAFLPLALPDDHPFWKADEEPLPMSEGPVAIKGASMLVCRRHGDVAVIPAAPIRIDMRHSEDKYGKFSYSSRFGMSVEAERWLHVGSCGDNILAVSHDGRSFRKREVITSMRMGETWIETKWNPMPGVSIASLQSFIGDWEIRIHNIKSEMDLIVVESGHAVPTRIGARGQKFDSFDPSPAGVVIDVDDGHRSAIADLGNARRALPVDVAPNTHLLFPHAAVPVLVGSLKPGETHWVSAIRADYQSGQDIHESLPSRATLDTLLETAGWNRLNSFSDAAFVFSVRKTLVQR